MQDPTPIPETISTPSPPPTLHHLSSSQSLRVLWALEELAPQKLPYNLITYARVAARSPKELQSISPLGKSPVLTIDLPSSSAQSERVLIQESRLILRYICDNYSNGVWAPTSANDKVRDEYWQEFANSSLSSILTIMVVFDSIASQSPFFVRPLMTVMSKAALSQIKKELLKPFAAMEAALANTDAEWFSGSKLGLADFMMSWPMDLASQRGYFATKEYPKIAEWLVRVHQREAYKRALAKGGSYNLATFDM